MNTVALVGRPNVGKSTLFNRLIGTRHAIIEDTPGVTRDRHYGIADWNGIKYSLIDTGGFIPGSEDTMERAIREQAVIAIEEADAIIFLCDAKDGVTSFDEDIATQLRRGKKKVVLVVNKCDNTKSELNALEFYKLGLGEPFPISAMNGHNTGDMLDELVSYLDSDFEENEDTRLKIAFLGRPNVGKSSLTNALLGQERMIVTDIPGTTRDAIDSVFTYNENEIVLIDTAGLRRKSRIEENVEFYSTIRTTRAIDKCDIGVILIDAERGLEEQDKRIINLVGDARKGIIVAINKWDLILDKDSTTIDKWLNAFKREMRTYDYVPLVFISALTKQRITKIFDLSISINENRNKRINTSELNKAILPILEATPPPSVRGYDLRINYITQVGTAPPLFTLFCNHPKLIPDSYKRFIERRMREIYNFEGTPISLLFKPKNVPYEERQK